MSDATISPARPAPAPSKALHVFLACAFLVAVGAFAAFGVMLDVSGAGAPSPTFGVVEIGIVAAVSGPALLIAAVAGRRRWMTATYLAAWAVLLTLAFTPWHPRKRFVRDLGSVKPGMNVDEVEAVMGKYVKGAGKKWVVPEGPAPLIRGPGEAPPADLEERVSRAQAAYVPPAYPGGTDKEHATGTMTYRWCDDDWKYDSDWGQVTFKDGRVVSVRFLPD